MVDNNKLPPLPGVVYGIWLPGTGWLKSRHTSGYMVAYAESNRSVARRYAAWVGNGARVEPVDPSLVALQDELLRYERERRERPRMVWNKFVQRVKALAKRMGEKWATLKT